MALDASTEASVRAPAAFYAPHANRRRAPSTPARAERDLVAAAQRGDIRERQRLIQNFRPLIVRTARSYRQSTSVDANELMQEGCVGLLEALRSYDPDLGVPFGAYARWSVGRAIQQLVAELSGPVVLSDRAVRQLVRVKRVTREYEQAEGRGPTVSELAAACDLSSTQVDRLIAADRDARTLSADDERGPREALVDPIGEDAYEATIWRVSAAQLPRMLDRLGERERRVIRARFGLDCRERTRGELACELCVSAERVRQIEQIALRKLSAACGVRRGA